MEVNINTIVEDLELKIEVFEGIRKEFFEKVQIDVLAPAFTYIFDKYPELDTVSWNQYTPWFNDGEACEFSVYCDYPRLNNETTDDFWSDATNKPFWFDQAEDEIKKIIGRIPDEVLKDVFGDHTTVTIKRDGTTKTTECDHE